MGKRRSRSESDADHRSGACAGGEAKRPRPEQKHLYLALDDWEKGYNLYKVDVHAIGSADTEAESQLPEPPVLQLEAAKGARDVLFAAVGTDILALWQPRYETTRTAVYDTATGRLDAAGPRHPRALQPMRFVVASSAGARGLYALHGGGMHFLERRGGGEATTEPRWTWSTACSSLRLPFDGMQPGSPRRTMQITSYAMHPDGRTVFVSATSGKHHGTFSSSLDDDDDNEWTRRGDWLLPFHGQGHYDAKLRAWVGLHSPGHVCTCDVPSTTFSSVAAATSQPPAWQLVNAEHLFQEDHPERGGTSLVSTGDAEFCIVESVTPKWMDPVWDRDEIDEYVLRVTRFRLKHDRHGQLRASSRCRRASYRVRKHDSVFAPQAFWM
ncbi:Os03g0236675 [Oryza sativa Japonica Group]|uniref:Os03g0236675 protein n=1 Tax=Oryza sativa subsp. japonica TaxID=39947 RepID=Q10PF3_ORYSJ|nr:hypothetical protein LOC_Os03g13340 [Oryza sativa Japonica Group]KAB8090975.1 hypothetical protein EE612_016358 [Oryza sativa]KAF2938228.1 hypothetical protein DAI22_03g102700 [Oryza sativa Japonica Group]BAS83151.1 Os03g0236675 [Oryza sativa Japonica Group]